MKKSSEEKLGEDKASNARAEGLKVERLALMGLLEVPHADRDTSAISAKILEIDQLLAMLEIQIRPMKGVPGRQLPGDPFKYPAGWRY
jgi:hypothetical protein